MTVREPEGVTLVLEEAAVATAPTSVGISCNVVAGHFHDHVFVPARR